APPPPPDAPVAVDAVPPKPDAKPPEPDAPPPPPPPPATVILNELSPDFIDQHDLVELLVTAGGTTKDIQLVRDYPHSPGVLAKLPDVVVATGDIIMVHLVPAGTTAMAETTAKDEFSTPDNFDGAWDFLGESADIPFTHIVLAVRDGKGTVTSAVPFWRSDM